MMDRSDFIHKFLNDPQKIGSITPSSSYLTKRMLENLPWDSLETIVELGAGTGVFTDYVASNKCEFCKMLIIEQDCKMREALQVRYPEFKYGTEAGNLTRLLNEYDLPKVDCIISGLPFALFPVELQEQIMLEVLAALKPDGIFIAYQYSLQMWLTLEYYFGEVAISFEPLNLPPAFVYCCTAPKNAIIEY